VRKEVEENLERKEDVRKVKKFKSKKS